MSALELTASLGRSASKTRRGAVTLSPDTINALGACAGDAVTLRAARVTTAIIVEDAQLSDNVIVVDELVLSNLRAIDGSTIKVEAVNLPELNEITLELSAALLSPDSELLRALLADKALTVGDDATLLPLENDSSNAAARKRISAILGASWSSFLVKVVDGDPSPGYVGARTRITIAPIGSPSTQSALADIARTRPNAFGPSPFGASPFGASPFGSSAPPPSGVGGMAALKELQVAIDQINEQKARTAARASSSSQGGAIAVKEVQLRTLEDLPTLENQAQQIEEWLDLGFNHASLLESLGTVPQMGVLVAGPAGSGKRSQIGRASCRERVF